MYILIIKSILDRCIGLVILITLLPIFFLLAIILSISFKGSPIFCQERPGKSGKIFKFYKFKTMNDHRDIYGKLLPDQDRLKPLGRFIRSTSLDEIPQLLNVLKGDMSLVGPRPLLVKYLHLYNSHQQRRHEVKPGMTGWAQVNGRNAITWNEKFDLDVWYVDNLSLYLDMKILWLTLIKSCKRKDINAPFATTMKPFTGNE